MIIQLDNFIFQLKVKNIFYALFFEKSFKEKNKQNVL